MKAFFARLKAGSLYAEGVGNKYDAYASVFEYIKWHYNTIRPHVAVDFKSLKQFEEHDYAQRA
jgi:transposase InsO family protein